MDWLTFILIWRPALFRVCLILTAVYAWKRGGAPERYAATMFCAALVAGLMLRNQSVPWITGIEPISVAIDLLLLTGLFWLALRADRKWPIWCFAWHLLASMGHLAKAFTPALYLPAYQIILILSSWPTLYLLARGVRNHQRRLRRNGVDPSWSNSSRLTIAVPE